MPPPVNLVARRGYLRDFAYWPLRGVLWVASLRLRARRAADWVRPETLAATLSSSRPWLRPPPLTFVSGSGRRRRSGYPAVVTHLFHPDPALLLPACRADDVARAAAPPEERVDCGARISSPAVTNRTKSSASWRQSAPEGPALPSSSRIAITRRSERQAPAPSRRLLRLPCASASRVVPTRRVLRLGRSDYAAVMATQQRWRQKGNGGPLEPEDRRRGPAAWDRRDQLRPVPPAALGLHHQARRHRENETTIPRNRKSCKRNQGHKFSAGLRMKQIPRKKQFDFIAPEFNVLSIVSSSMPPGCSTGGERLAASPSERGRTHARGRAGQGGADRGELPLMAAQEPVQGVFTLCSRSVISGAAAWWMCGVGSGLSGWTVFRRGGVVDVRCRKRPLRLDGVQAQPRRPPSTVSATTSLAHLPPAPLLRLLWDMAVAILMWCLSG